MKTFLEIVGTISIAYYLIIFIYALFDIYYKKYKQKKYLKKYQKKSTVNQLIQENQYVIYVTADKQLIYQDRDHVGKIDSVVGVAFPKKVGEIPLFKFKLLDEKE